jgi:hypothetical protein
MPQWLQSPHCAPSLLFLQPLLITFQAIRNFQGGSETFLSLVATSHISSADSVLPHLEVINPANLATHIDALRGYIGDITLTFDMLVERFLRGRGIPCRVRFEESTGAFHPIIDLSKINTVAFRPQMVVWAATGTPFLSPTGANVLVSACSCLPSSLSHARQQLGPINTHGDGYGAPGDNAAARDRLAGAGTFHLATCFRTVRYPVEHVLRLAQVHYNPEAEPASFQEAFDFWFLYQCLIAIGRHNIL